ncbi:hypothetical protein RDABS01_011490 [Bienertia sinuspersici]
MNSKSLPDEIEVEILVRLPVKSIQQFKSVCKRWLSLIESPSFICRYNQNSSRFRRGKLFCYGIEPIAKPRLIKSYDHNNPTERIMEDLDLPPFIDDNSWVLEGADIHQLDPIVERDTEKALQFDTDLHIIGHVNEYCNNFINGTCHWSCTIREEPHHTVSEYGILAFGMVDHSFKVMRGPPIPVTNIYNKDLCLDTHSVWGLPSE